MPFSPSAICETADNERRAWIRHDLQNIPLTPDRRAAIEREKGISDFENARCREFNLDDIDADALAQFRQSFLEDGSNDYSSTDLLRKAGAVEREPNGTLWLTNAGIIVFGRNPQGRFARAYIRLMKFDCRSDDRTGTGLPSLDHKFDGPLTVQLRNLRAFLQTSGFFKAYQRRGEKGGFWKNPNSLL